MWQPLPFAATIGVVPTLPARGAMAMVEFAAAALVALVAAAASWALFTRAPAAHALTRLAIAACLVRQLQSLAWTALPSDVIPGTRGPIALAAIAVAALLWAGNERLASRS